MGNKDCKTKVETDWELLEKISQKDKDAFNVLYQRYCLLLVNKAFQMLHEKEATEDVTQLFWINVWEKADIFCRKEGKKKNASGPFLKTLRHITIDYLRFAQTQREREMYMENDMAGELELSSMYTHIFEDMELEDAKRLFEKVVDELPDVSRKIFKMKWYKLMPYKKIAKKTNLSVDTVKKKYQKAQLHVEGRMRIAYGQKLVIGKGCPLPFVILSFIHIFIR